MAREKTIEELFSSSFAGEEQVPPSSLQENLFDSLDGQEVEDLYKDNFEDEEVKPSPTVWPRISRALWLAGFLSFSYNRLNIYYVAGAIGLAGIALFPNNDAPNTQLVPQPVVVSEQTENLQQDSEQKAIIGTSVEDEKSRTKESTIAPLVQQTVDTETASVNKADAIEKASLSALPQDKQESNGTEKVFITGDSIICLGSTAEYGSSIPVEGAYFTSNLPNADFKGNSIEFNELGTFTVFLKDKSERTIAEKQITVQYSTASEILGDSVLCRNGSDQTLRVRSSKDIGIQYNWDLANNKYEILGNGYIKIIASITGPDTAILTEINNNTGCVSVRKKSIIVLPEPNADFEVQDLGGHCLKIIYTDSQLRHRWYIEGDKTSLKNNEIRFEKPGDYQIKHEVIDGDGCTASVVKDIDVGDYSVFIPNAFAPKKEMTTFKIVASGLAKYRIEVFNAENKKLWESTALNDGEPTEGWDGLHNGEMQTPGLYYFRMSATFQNGAEWRGIETNGSFSKTGKFFLVE